MKVCIIGAGIIGIGVALKLKQKYGPSVDITIFSDRFSPETTGDGSAGFVKPHLDPDTPKEKIVRWAGETLNLCKDLLMVKNSVKDLHFLSKGVSLVPVLHLFDKDDKENSSIPSEYDPPPWHLSTIAYQNLDERAISQLGYGENRHAQMFWSFTFEPAILIPQIYEWLKFQGGVKFVQRKLSSLEEVLDLGFDFVINCPGAGARFLVGDENIVPTSGHILRAKVPGIKHSIFHVKPHGAYIIPLQDSVVLGSVDRPGNWDLTPVPGDRERIIEKCAGIWPGIRNAEILREWIGLRPVRKGGVRLEMEKRESSGGKTVNVIHNYGHGGSGVTLFWGCASDVLDLIQKAKTQSKL